MYTHEDYLNKVCTHRQYYAQFVTQGQKNRVLNQIGLDKLLKSEDEHLNDIPLKQWDNIGLSMVPANLLKEHGDSYTLAVSVCINKEAAKQIIEGQNNV